MKMLQFVMNLGRKMNLIQKEDFVNLQSMVLGIRIIAVRTGKRFGINATGIQGINCKSTIYFNHKNNAVNFSINLCKYSLSRFENPIVNKTIISAIKDPNLNENNVKIKLLLSEITEKEYDALFDDEPYKS